MDRDCPECGDPLTPLVETNEMVSAAGGTYLCSSCQIGYRVDATNALVELEP